MRAIFKIFAVIILAGYVVNARAQEGTAEDKQAVRKIMLMVVEQNVSGPQHVWWTTAMGLSAVEQAAANKLKELGYNVAGPEEIKGFLEENPAFRRVHLSGPEIRKIGEAGEADYVIKGRALASRSGGVPAAESMRTYHASVSAKILSVNSCKSVGRINLWGRSTHIDPVIGSAEALKDAGERLAVSVANAIGEGAGGE